MAQAGAAVMAEYGSAPQPSPLLKPESSETDGSGSHGSDGTVIGIVSVVSGLVAVSLILAGVLGYCCYKRKRRRKGENRVQQANVSSQQTSGTCTPDYRRSSADCVQHPPPIRVIRTEAQVFTYRQLQSVTDNFSPANVIGNGGFGLVYRSILPDGKMAAIKELDRHGKQGEREFRVEVDLLSRLHSPFLLQLIGYCADQDHRLLVYEYMPNGSLQECLYSDGAAGNPPAKLDWARRMRIALDGARGLEYLHDRVTPPVIHRDFKTSNILLDENFNAKVSDFGLAKFGSDKSYGQVSTRVLGTTGYVAPEYAMTGHLTTKSDVYSFGVVLLELLTGKVPVDMKRPAGQGVLVTWALPYLMDRDKVIELVDSSLEGQYSKRELIQVATIIAMCVQSEVDNRPPMADVVQSLIPLVGQRNGYRITCSPNYHHDIMTLKPSPIRNGSNGSSSTNSPCRLTT